MSWLKDILILLILFGMFGSFIWFWIKYLPYPDPGKLNKYTQGSFSKVILILKMDVVEPKKVLKK